ncbi:MAG: ABC transporter substrate-binding protein [Defluviitaleaceae bacterium]|nr:ABC transporter substrate-binding protein [Defluviitaleaceae bacterium]
MKKLLLALVVVAALALAACNQAAGPAQDTGTAAPAGDAATGAADQAAASDARMVDGIDVSDFVEVIWYQMGDWPINGQLEAAQEEWNAILEDRVNAHMTIRFIGWTDWTAQYALRLASGDGFDMIFTSTTWLDAWPNAQRGAFMPLDDLIPVYAPRTWSAVPQEHWDQARFNGEIVLLPGDSYTQWVNHGFYYRGDWADQIGIQGPITNWDMLEQYFQGILDLFDGEIVPWDTPAHPMTWELWLDSHTGSLEVIGAAGLYRSRGRDNLAEVFSPIFDDIFLEYAIRMYDWGNRGFWREDVLHFTGDTRALMEEGRTGSDQHHTQTYRGLINSMERLQPGSDLRMFHTHLVPGYPDNLMRSTVTHDAMSVGANAANPGRALMIYDLFRFDEQLQHLIRYGREGVQYVINEDGLRAEPEGFDHDAHGFDAGFWQARNDELTLWHENDWLGVIDIWNYLDSRSFPFQFAGFVWDQSPVVTQAANVGNVYNAQLPGIAMGRAGDPVAAVERLRNDLRAAGIEAVIDEANNQLAAWYANR